MVKKLQKKSGDEAASGASAQLASTVKESAQQIWLAGLGAFSKAQEEGGKVFEALVREGVTLQRRTQSAAEEKLSEATTRMTSMANDLSTKASGQWDKLETIFEERVSRALKKLGVPTAREIDELTRRVEELNRAVTATRGTGTTGATRKTAARKTAAKRPTAQAAGKRVARKAAR
ncbi:MAG: poly granule associated protein [Comamonadaceae bacterium]|nr:MAG: poly granule associated protein [Comamonadaceae bacterium]